MTVVHRSTKRLPGQTPPGHGPAEVRLPPAPRLPRAVQGIGFSVSRKFTVDQVARRCGDVFTLRIPVFGPTVIVADPALAKQVFTANTDDVGNIVPNLSRVLGPGSVFALDGTDHRLRRKLLTPPLHGKSIKNYERIFEEETLRESAAWPQGEALRDARADDADHAERDPAGGVRRRRCPSRRTAAHHPALGHARLATRGAAHALSHLRPVHPVGPAGGLPPTLRRGDRPADRRGAGRPGTSTPATTCSRCCCAAPTRTARRCRARTSATNCSRCWPPDTRRRRPPWAGSSSGSAATRRCWPSWRQKRRPTPTTTGRPPSSRCSARAPSSTSPAAMCTRRRSSSANGSIPQGYSILVAIAQMHRRADDFPDPHRFDPGRFIGQRPATFAHIPFGGGTRRCVGATFANVEMDVVLRTVLRQFVIEPTSAPAEKSHFRGVAHTPTRRRPRGAAPPGDVDRVRPACAGAASSRPAGSGRCSRWGSAAGSPDAPARPPRSPAPGSPR